MRKWWVLAEQVTFKLLATNQYDKANWFMHAGVTVYVAIYRHVTWWLINHDACEASIAASNIL